MIGATKTPTAQASEQAQAAHRALAALRRETRSVQLQSGGTRVTVPREAFEVFLEVLEKMGHGNAVMLVSDEEELTTQQAADILNVSRPYLIGLLEAGKLPFRMVGSHRRLRTADVLAFKEADDRERRAKLDELTEEAQKHGLGY